jgi:hypothetical protein
MMQVRLGLQHRLASIAVTSVAFILLGVDDRAYAQSAEAEVLFNDGYQLMEEGNLAQACDAFEASNRIEPGAGTLIYLGECREKNQQLASAWSAYKAALTRVTDPRKRNFATAKATALEARLSYLMVLVSDESRIDGLTLTRNGKSIDPMLWNRTLPVDGGDYIIAGGAPGHEKWQTTIHVPIEGAKVSVEVPKLKGVSDLSDLMPLPEPAPARPLPSTSLSVAERHEHEAVRPTGILTTRRKVALGVAGQAVISVVVGVVVHASAKDKRDEAFKLCPDPATPCTQADEANALIKSSHSQTFQANIAFGIAGAAAIGAGVLWITGAPHAENPKRVTVVPSMMPGETGIAVMGRF